MPPAHVGRDKLPAEWPTHEGIPAFWEELGRGVAAFGFLEDILARAYFALTAAREYATIDEAEAAFPKWRENFERSLTDTLASLTSKFSEASENDDRVPPDTGSAIVRRLGELRTWRNALCHALVAEFARASDAVSAVLTFQSGNAILNSEIRDDICPEIRVGISLGEVVFADGPYGIATAAVR